MSTISGFSTTELCILSLDFIIIVFGLCGNIVNVTVLTRLKMFRSNHCAFYLRIESIINMIQLIQLLINEIWKISLNGTDPINSLLAWCKIRSSIQQLCRLLIAFVFCFAAIDQFLITNPLTHLRRIGSFRLAYRQIIFALLFCFLHGIPFAYYLTINSVSICAIMNAGLVQYYSFFYYPFLNGLFPIVVSSVFSILAYRNVRHIVRRQITVERRRLDQQLTAMIFSRVLTSIILSLPYIIHRIYLMTFSIERMSPYEYSVNQVVSTIVVFLVYINHAVNHLCLRKQSSLLYICLDKFLCFNCNIKTISSTSKTLSNKKILFINKNLFESKTKCYSTSTWNYF